MTFTIKASEWYCYTFISACLIYFIEKDTSFFFIIYLEECLPSILSGKVLYSYFEGYQIFILFTKVPYFHIIYKSTSSYYYLQGNPIFILFQMLACLIFFILESIKKKLKSIVGWNLN